MTNLMHRAAYDLASVLPEVERLHIKYHQTLDPRSVDELRRVLEGVQREWGRSERHDHDILDTVVVAIAIIFPGVAGAYPLHRLFEDLNLEVAVAWAM